MLALHPEAEPSQEYQPDLYEVTTSEVAQAYQLVQDYDLDKLLQPLARYYPDTAEPLHLLLGISHTYDWQVEEVASVILDTANKYDPLFASTEEFVPYNTPNGIEVGPYRGQSQGQAVIVRFGQEQTVTNLIDRPLPDSWNANMTHTAEMWRKRAEIAEDITLYLAEGVNRLLDHISPANLFEGAEAIKPYSDVANYYHLIADVIEHGKQQIAKERTRSEIFRKILQQPDDLPELMIDDSPVNEAEMEKSKAQTNRLILSAWRKYSEMPTFTPQEHQVLLAESKDALREMKVMSVYIKEDLRDKAHQLTY